MNARPVRVRIERDASPASLPRFNGASCVYGWFRTSGDLDRDVFIVCFLDTKNRLTGLLCRPQSYSHSAFFRYGATVFFASSWSLAGT